MIGVDPIHWQGLDPLFRAHRREIYKLNLSIELIRTLRALSALMPYALRAARAFQHYHYILQQAIDARRKSERRINEP